MAVSLRPHVLPMVRQRSHADPNRCANAGAEQPSDRSPIRESTLTIGFAEAD